MSSYWKLSMNVVHLNAFYKDSNRRRTNWLHFVNGKVVQVMKSDLFPQSHATSSWALPRMEKISRVGTCSDIRTNILSFSEKYFLISVQFFFLIQIHWLSFSNANFLNLPILIFLFNLMAHYFSNSCDYTVFPVLKKKKKCLRYI